MMIRHFMLPLMTSLCLAACSPSAVTTPSENSQSAAVTQPVIGYSEAFIMEPIGGRDMTMGGVTVTVEAADARLIGASSPEIGTIELHTMAMTDGKMRMRQVEGFDIAAGETLSLKRGSDHFMMFDVSEAVQGGETIDLTLEFETASAETLTLVVPAEVRTIGD